MICADSRGGPRAPETGAQINVTKAELRARVRRDRSAFPLHPVRTALRQERAIAISRRHRAVALYASAGNEPDTWLLADDLLGRGIRVLMPMLSARLGSPDWGVYRGRDFLRPGWRGIPEPAGPALGAEALAEARVVWASALAATPTGDRLGMGGGWYDRALAFADPSALVGVLLNEREVLPLLPVDAWDRRIGLIVTEARLLSTG